MAGCERCDGNPPKRPGDEDQTAERIREVIDEVEDIVDCQNAGSVTDWDAYEFFYFELVKEWRRIERLCEITQAARIRAFMTAMPGK